MLLGLGSVVIALVEPQQSGIQTGFIVSTIGISAIVFGVQAVKTARWGSATARAFGRGGAILGSVGTALMAYAVIGSALAGTGVHLPALSLPLDGRSAVVGTVAVPFRSAVAAPVESALPSSTPEPAAPPAPAPAPATVETERSAVVQSAGTLAFVMEQRFGAGPYPSTLSVGMTAPERILLPDGTGLAAVPDGARVLYSVAPDGTAWSITIIGAQFGAVATYSSTIGTVESG
ncbi:hypothetical protein DEJ00_16695 [Curtobacterium sp. MCLR17_039]|uniref:hypothetical protein n=1 Tax=Curtobacterium sp. MCLR17_039 TaxID=2175624 RepID=UPI000DA721A8|nr:hypothetical protein [Curtobacterium sp. MCLR17_039]PZE87347.1 hypothetical protein DEJ00_16695 [Curtobacterium sp. MCLR17_039]